jgi:hypothetical protein
LLRAQRPRKKRGRGRPRRRRRRRGTLRRRRRRRKVTRTMVPGGKRFQVRASNRRNARRTRAGMLNSFVGP